MKYNLPKDAENQNHSAQAPLSRIPFLFMIVLFISFACILYSLNLLHPSSSSCKQESPTLHNISQDELQRVLSQYFPSQNPKPPEKTSLQHIVFGIASSQKLWNHRKYYSKLWWRPGKMRGAVWLDKPIKNCIDDHLLPPVRISGDTSSFKYSNRDGDRSALRISRIVSESLKLGMENVRWFVMGDDDTFFVPENLVRVLGKYDHEKYYYIGSKSESHLQNILFSYNMAYGGGGFAISFPLAKALAKMQDRCIERYTNLYASDERIQACIAELGVSLTEEKGFHQFDVYGNVYGLLAAHPPAPLVSLHHLDLIEPIFPNADRVQFLRRLKLPIKLDSAALMQQSICYDPTRSWSVSVSWGYAFDVYGNVYGLLAAHPPAPLVSLHHLDLIEPIFPNADRVQSLRRLKLPIKLDSAALMQQSICYDPTRTWSVSVSWGYAVEIAREIILPREMEVPARTMINWHKRAGFNDLAFNTRPVSPNTCVYHFVNGVYNVKKNETASKYVLAKGKHKVSNSKCNWKREDPLRIDTVKVFKRPDPNLWDKAVRRNCCRILSTEEKTMVVNVGVCEPDEIIGLDFDNRNRNFFL